MSETRYAILIGNQTFAENSGLLNLRCPNHDVAGWEKVLRDPTKGNFEKITVLNDRPSHEIAEQVHAIIADITRDDLLLVFYSGHGKQSLQGDLYLAASNTKSKTLETSALSVKALRDLFNNSPCGKIIFILDCCFAGSAGNAFKKGALEDSIQAAAHARGTYVLTASTNDQAALEKDADTFSLFTKHLLDGLQTGRADRTGSGGITVQQMFEYARAGVLRESTQDPKFYAFDVSDAVVLAASGRDRSKERIQKITQTLHRYAAEDRMPDKVFGQAMTLLSQSADTYSPPQVELRGLLDELADGKLSSSYFLVEWASRPPAAEPKVILPSPPPTPAPAPDPVISEKPAPPSRKLTFRKKIIIGVTVLIFGVSLALEISSRSGPPRDPDKQYYADLQTNLAGNAAYDRGTVMMQVSNGTVILTGSVGSVQEKEDLIRRIKGTMSPTPNVGIRDELTFGKKPKQ